MVTLAALCWREKIDLDIAALRELCRIEDPEVMEKIRRKQAAKSAVGMGISPNAACAPEAHIWINKLYRRPKCARCKAELYINEDGTNKVIPDGEEA